MSGFTSNKTETTSNITKETDMYINVKSSEQAGKTQALKTFVGGNIKKGSSALANTLFNHLINLEKLSHEEKLSLAESNPELIKISEDGAVNITIQVTAEIRLENKHRPDNSLDKEVETDLGNALGSILNTQSNQQDKIEDAL